MVEPAKDAGQIFKGLSPPFFYSSEQYVQLFPRGIKNLSDFYNLASSFKTSSFTSPKTGFSLGFLLWCRVDVLIRVQVLLVVFFKFLDELLVRDENLLFWVWH